jgi:HK97 family phage major capsid protein
MKQNFLIKNGFRDRVTRLWAYPKIKFGMGLLLFALFLFLQPLASPFAVAMPWLPALKFDKNGLTGDNEKLLSDLENRIKLEAGDPKEAMLEIVREAQKELNEMAVRFKDLSDDKVTLLKELLGADDKGIRTILQKQGEVLKKLQENIDRKPEDMSTRAQVVRWRDANKDALLKIKNGETASLTPLEVRLNSPMLPANTYSGAYIPRPEFEAGATEIIRPRLSFWDYITKGRAGSAVYVWVNKTSPEGAAAWIGPGVAKPGVSLELASEVSNAKKVAASEKVALELLEDVEGFASYIEQELKFQVDKATNEALISAVGSGTSPAGIRTYSVLYSVAGIKTINPNYHDALVAAVAQLRAGNLDGAVTIFVNPIDNANMRLTKAVSQGQLFNPSALDATVVEDNNIPIGYFQAAILQYYNVKIYKDYTVTYGWENDDFTKNLVTLVGERRIHQYVKTPHTGAFIYDTFANVLAAIESEALPA